MCGIAGLFDLRGRRDFARDLAVRINDIQFHRGPDEGAVHLEPGVALCHRRLSIIDIATGQQPLFNEDGSVAVVFNGEIYNYLDLVPELQALGHVFRTRSDTEVIVHAWEAWGEACVARFRGMFAFAIHDRNRQTLFLARDRMGVKPLFYAELDDGSLLFGSELKALTAHPGFRRDIDPLAVEEYFALGYVAEPRSIYRGAHKLLPAHTMTFRRGHAVFQQRSYWDVRFTLDNPIAAEGRVAPPPRRVGTPASDVGSPAWRVSFGWRRFQCGSRGNGGHVQRGGTYLCDRIRGPIVQRVAVCAGCGYPLSH